MRCLKQGHESPTIETKNLKNKTKQQQKYENEKNTTKK